MSLKKTSILALSVLLFNESFAVTPTVRTGTVRLGSAAQTASTGRGKVTTSVEVLAVVLGRRLGLLLMVILLR